MIGGRVARGLIYALVVFGGLMPTVSVAAQEIRTSAQPRREILGVVRDSATSRPLADAIVLITELGVTARTDIAGHFHLTGLFPAAVTLQVRQVGFAPVVRRVALTSGSATVDVKLARRVTELEGITVRDDAAQRLLDAQQSTVTMAADEIARKRGQTLGETMKDLPGVSIIQYGPSIAKPMVRGLHSQRIATINAGVPQEGQQWGGDHAPEIDAFAANEIEVVRGPGTILYGSGALGGVVRVSPRPLPRDSGVAGEFSANGFSNNRQGAGSFMLEGAHVPMLGDVAWRGQISARHAGDATTPDYFLPNSGFRELDYNGALGIRRGWGSSELNVSRFSTNLGLYLGAHVGNIEDLERAMQNPFTTTVYADRVGPPNQRITHDLVSWRTDIGMRKNSRLNVSYGFQRNDRAEYDSRGFSVGTGRPAFGLKLYTHSLDVQWKQPPTTRFSGTVGVSGMRQGNLSPGRSFLIPQYRIYAGGVFALEEYTRDALTVTLGARYDVRWQHAFQFGAPVVISPDDISTYRGASGSLGASYRLSPTWSLAGTAALAWRPPNVSERFSRGVHHGTAQYEIGDPTLVPERTINGDVSLRHVGVRSRLELGVYQNRITDYIYLTPRDPVITVRGAYPAYAYAHTTAQLRGFELTGQFSPTAWITLYASANRVRGIDRNRDTPLYDMPADRLTSSLRLFGRTGARVQAPYVEFGSTIVRRQDRVPPVTIYRLPTDGYALASLQVGAAGMHLLGLHVVPDVSVRNVFDRRYRDYLSRYRLFVNETGRDVVVRFTVPLGNHRARALALK